MIFNFSSGGGSVFTYRVLAMASIPTEAGKANDIAIITETAIGDVQLNCASEPTTRSDSSALQAGDVCIMAALPPNASFNAIKKSSLRCILGQAYQHNGTRFIRKDAYLYQGDTWVRFSAILSASAFSYTGSSAVINDGNGDWRIKLLTSGTLTCTTAGDIDVFLVGGGGNGGQGNAYSCGGAGGRTYTKLNIEIAVGSYPVTIGGAGGNTTALGYTGGAGGAATPTVAGVGGSGGGGAGSIAADDHGGNGGSNGSRGGNAYGSNASSSGGAGQGTTTREFGESTGALYGGGGGGGSRYAGTQGAGGAGGGGAGGTATPVSNGVSGTANTGGGGGGQGYSGVAGAGGSGIVVIRNARTVA